MTLDIYKDFDALEDAREHMRRPANTQDYDRPCVRCGLRRSVHGGENGYLQIAHDDERAYKHMRGALCLYRR